MHATDDNPIENKVRGVGVQGAKAVKCPRIPTLKDESEEHANEKNLLASGCGCLGWSACLPRPKKMRTIELRMRAK